MSTFCYLFGRRKENGCFEESIITYNVGARERELRFVQLYGTKYMAQSSDLVRVIGFDKKNTEIAIGIKVCPAEWANTQLDRSARSRRHCKVQSLQLASCMSMSYVVVQRINCLKLGGKKRKMA